ncbi:MAG: FtsX-like permease family protein [Bacteroidetes bacterium]|nr:MAG: FtsX-like permease family protein [Bacteroidota bacterium]
MTVRDLIAVSTGNMWRMKFRAMLTMTGVLIAIAAFVSMISFGAGNQQYIEDQFNKLGLFSTLQVYPKEREKENSNEPDTVVFPPLDKAALERFTAIPGVNLVYPYDAFSVKVQYGDSLVDSKGQALPTAATRTKLFSVLEAGTGFESDSSKQAIISSELMKELGFDTARSAIGKRIVVSVRVSTIDSGLAHILVDKGETLLDRLKKIHFDSLFYSKYRGKVIRAEANEVARRFVNGFLNARKTVSDTLTICGVREHVRAGRLRIEPVIIPFETAALFSTSGLGESPTEIFSALTSGKLFSTPEDAGEKTFSRVTIDFDPKVPYTAIRDSVEKLGFRTFSFAAEFEEIQRAFLYFDLALGAIGLIALITASLGIVNTMVMSVNERKREIGVLKSLGADESEIRWLFLVEAGVIGVLGTSAGIAAGWGITRIVSAIAQHYMEQEGIPPIDLFALPLWLISIAMAVGVGVSLLAGFYPAARAARVDPVAALRNE